MITVLHLNFDSVLEWESCEDDFVIFFLLHSGDLGKNVQKIAVLMNSELEFTT